MIVNYLGYLFFCPPSSFYHIIFLSTFWNSIFFIEIKNHQLHSFRKASTPSFWLLFCLCSLTSWRLLCFVFTRKGSRKRVLVGINSFYYNFKSIIMVSMEPFMVFSQVLNWYLAIFEPLITSHACVVHFQLSLQSILELRSYSCLCAIQLCSKNLYKINFIQLMVLMLNFACRKPRKGPITMHWSASDETTSKIVSAVSGTLCLHSKTKKWYVLLTSLNWLKVITSALLV